ncbi:hypothetical protein DICVIV_09854 [Dictyocaulus viviparus]|uniref:CBS domain-containing protein n=1 Tax=Dictyocaulus viviparus TaxID=29172 RepID=A0A0D8XHH7_DICVI|nr:hypothetical protein DICVIV_09854 [Dictyocaulus viviparus]
MHLCMHVPQTATCDDAINLFLEKRISSVPVVDSLGCVLGVIRKSDVMYELIRHPSNYLEILDIPIMDIVASKSPPVYGTATMTFYDCIATLVNTDRQSIHLTVDNKLNYAPDDLPPGPHP